MSVINYQLSTSSSCTSMWLKKALFSHEINHSNIFLTNPPAQLMKSFMKVFDLLHLEFYTNLSLNHQQNRDIYKILRRILAEYELRKKCEIEMYVSNSEHHSNSGCLIFMSNYSNQNHNSNNNSSNNNHNYNKGNVDNKINHEYIKSTSIPLHGRASSQFTIPSLSNGKLITISQLMKGIATASLIHEQYELLLLIIILHSNKNLLFSCLLYIQQIYLFKQLSSNKNNNGDNNNDISNSLSELSINIHHNLLQIQEFCLDSEIIQENLIDINHYNESVNDNIETSNINDNFEIISPLILNENSKKFLKWINNKKSKTMNEINNEIEKYINYYNNIDS